VGIDGRVIGIDFTPAMIEKAKHNAAKMDYSNVEFRLGDIEDIPVSAQVADVVVSNCVLNLIPDKNKVFKEIFRILKVGGHFSISDVVLTGTLPDALLQSAEMYAGCVSGAVQKEEYLKFIESNGFKNITIQKEKVIVIPDDILQNYLPPEEIKILKNSKAGIYSITVYAEKPQSCGCDTSCC
jgi:SAM-dependent methyltransferase